MNRFKSSLVSALDRKIFTMVFSLICLLLAGHSGIQAQDKHSQQNFQPGIPYAISDIESINTTNGNLMFNFGFGSVRGRGTAQQGISLKYNSKLYESHVMTTLDLNGDLKPQKFIRPDYEGGWKYDGDYEIRVINRNDELDQPVQVGGGCEEPNYAGVYVFKLMVYFPDGSQHEFRPTGYSDSIYNSSGNPTYLGDGYFNVSPTGEINTLIWTTSGASTMCDGNPSYSTYVVPSIDPNPAMVYYSTDGTFMRLEIPQGQTNINQWTIYMPDGSKVTNGELDAQSNVLPQRVYDENGNFVTKGQVTLPDSSTVTGYIDQMGRYVARKAISSTEDHIYKLGINGAPIIWKIKWKYITVIRPYRTSGAGGGIGKCCYSDQVMVAQHKVIDEIETPSQLGGLKYTFNYNGHEGQVAYNQNPNNPNSSPGWGDLIDVTLPSGAKAEYDYSHQIAFGTDDLLPLLGKIKEKRLLYETNYDGNTQQVTETWLYSISQSGTTTITGPDGGVTTQKFSNTTTDNDLSGRVYKETSPGGTIVERIWANNKVGGCPSYGCGSMRRLNTYVKTEFTTIPDNAGNPSLTAIKDYEYDKNGNVTKITEYDWMAYSAMPGSSSGNITGIPGGATVKRITENVYYNPTEDASNSTANNANSYWNSTAKKVNNAVKSTTVKHANLTPVSHTEIVYDNADTTANPTQTRKWDSTKAATFPSPDGNGFRLNSGNAVVALTTYDQYGNPLTITDPKGYVTNLTYGSINGYSNLYPTQTEKAYQTSVERTSTMQYDFYTGLVTSAMDVDNNLTNATEYDDLGRPIKSIAAQGTALEMWTTTEYNDILRRVIVRSDLETKGDGKKIAVQHYDELGRVRLSRRIENAATEDPTNEQHGIKVQTRYKMGNPYSYTLTSNPYRAATSSQAANEDSMGWTRSKSINTGKYSETESFTGAALPHPFLTSGYNTNSTGKVRTDIDADRVLVTDQAGKQRISKTNALGQLTDVWEITAADSATEGITFGSPQISLNGYKTGYEYDPLNNLTKVIQGSQTNRTFSYSSLSRLKTAFNPESGTISYLYDNNGNLTEKTDARGVKTDYSYDELNRVTLRDYSDLTPDVTYTYSTTAPVVGQLIKVENSYSKTEYTQFDILGRVTKSKQTTDGTAYNEMEYVYNLSGGLVEQKYPSGRVVKNILDNDGELSIVQSKKNANAGYWDYAKNFTFTAAGAVSSMQLGNGKWESAVFNSRLQPTQIALGTVQGGDDKLKLNFEYGVLNWDGSVLAGTNNGNVARQIITTPTTGSTSGFTATQYYTYDSLNRIKIAKENIQTEGQSVQLGWQQQFVYDRYGNRTFNEGSESGQYLTTTLPRTCGTEPNLVCPADNPAADTTNNRLNGFTFDNAGNTEEDPGGREFTYDGENKQILVKDSSGNRIGEYFYDGDGKRVKKIEFSNNVATQTTIFVYDASGKMVAEYATNVEPTQTARVSYLTSDHLGSPRITTDKDGRVFSRRDFMPFGEELDSTHTAQRDVNLNYGEDGLRQKFTSYERDTETDLDFAQARYYSNQHGRFTTVDPIMLEVKRLVDPQAINLYLYTRNNPLKYVDPDGEKFKGTDDQEVIIEREKVNGKKIWVIKSGNASKDLQKLVNLINDSGSRTASNMFKKLNKHETMINLVIDSTTSRTQEEINTGSTTIGLHEPHDKNGPVTFNSTTDKFDGKADPAVDDKGNVIKGAYREATITLYEKKMEELGYSGERLNGKMVAVFGHEARHDLDPLQVQAGLTGTGSNDIWHPSKQGKPGGPRIPKKESPHYFGNKIIRQIERSKGIIID